MTGAQVTRQMVEGAEAFRRMAEVVVGLKLQRTGGPDGSALKADYETADRAVLGAFERVFAPLAPSGFDARQLGFMQALSNTLLSECMQGGWIFDNVDAEALLMDSEGRVAHDLITSVADMDRARGAAPVGAPATTSDEGELAGVRAFGAMLREIGAMEFDTVHRAGEDPEDILEFDWYHAQRKVKRLIETAFIGPMQLMPANEGWLKALTWYLVLSLDDGWEVKLEDFDGDMVLRCFDDCTPPGDHMQQPASSDSERTGALAFLRMLRAVRATPEIPMSDAVRKATQLDPGPDAVTFDYAHADDAVAQCLRAVGTPDSAAARGLVKAIATHLVSQELVHAEYADADDDTEVKFLLTANGFRDPSAPTSGGVKVEHVDHPVDRRPTLTAAEREGVLRLYLELKNEEWALAVALGNAIRDECWNGTQHEDACPRLSLALSGMLEERLGRMDDTITMGRALQLSEATVKQLAYRKPQ